MLYDKARIDVQAGPADSCASFRHEAHVPRGGPTGATAGTATTW